MSRTDGRNSHPNCKASRVTLTTSSLCFSGSSTQQGSCLPTSPEFISHIYYHPRERESFSSREKHPGVGVADWPSLDEVVIPRPLRHSLVSCKNLVSPAMALVFPGEGVLRGHQSCRCSLQGGESDLCSAVKGAH